MTRVRAASAIPALAVAFASIPAEACITDSFKCSLQAGSAPNSDPSNEPASFAYTINKGAKDSYAVDLDGKATFDLGLSAPLFALGEVVWHRNNQQKKPQNDFEANAGFHYEWDNTPSAGPITSTAGLVSVFVDGKVGYVRKSIFADPLPSECGTDPTAAFCRTQRLESVRATLEVSPFLPFFESEQKRKPVGSEPAAGGAFEGPAIAYSFAMVGGAFADKIAHNQVDPKTGALIRGEVSGVRAQANLALSPKFTNYRLTFRGSAQLVQTVSRAAGRAADFDRSTHLFTASVDYDFGRSSLDTCENCVPSLRPSVGLTWTSGSDPLTGKKKQTTTVIGFKLAFK